jgi:zinc protease
MKYSIHIIFVFLLAIGLSAYEMGDFVRDIKTGPLDFTFPEIKKEHLADGTEILALANQDFPIVYAEFQIYYGRKNLGNRNTEVVRLLEDSWEFSGSKSFPKDSLLQEFEKLGATFSLSLDYEKSTISLSYLKKDEKRVIELLKSFWNEPSLDPEVTSTMRVRIEDEIKRRNDNPTSLGTRKIKERVFKDTIAGKKSSLAGLAQVTIEDLSAFQKEILSEKKRILLLTGDADTGAWKEYLKLLPAYDLKGSKAEEIQSDILRKNISDFKGEHVLVEKDVSQAFVVMMGVLPKHNDPDFYAIQVLNYIIGGGGFNSYYMREIRNNRGLAYSAGSSADFQKGYGTINFYAMTKVESTVEVLTLMKDMLKKDFIASLKEDELKRAQVAIVNQFVFLFDDGKKVLQNDLRFKDHEMPKDYLANFRANIEKVTLEDMRRVGLQYFDPKGLTVLVVGPKKLKESLGSNFKVIQAEENSF